MLDISALKSLYDITGKITDHNTLLVNRGDLEDALKAHERLILATTQHMDLKTLIDDYLTLREDLKQASRELDTQTKQAEDTAALYEELRKLIDGGHESMTHADAVGYLKHLLAKGEVSTSPPVVYVDNAGVFHSNLSAEQVEAVLSPVLAEIRASYSDGASRLVDVPETPKGLALDSGEFIPANEIPFHPV